MIISLNSNYKYAKIKYGQLNIANIYENILNFIEKTKLNRNYKYN